MAVEEAMDPRAFQAILDQLWKYSPYGKCSVSSVTISPFAVFLKEEGKPELCLVRGKAVATESGEGGLRLLLTGDVVFVSRLGGTLRCDEAVLRLGPSPEATVRNAVVATPTGTERVGRVSFPLISLVDDSGFANRKGIWSIKKD